MSSIGFVCPVYDACNLRQYTEAAIGSFFRTTPNGVAIVIDDASAGWSSGYADELQAMASGNQRVVTHHFEKWGGLTRSWNYGLNIAADMKLDYAIAGNNDVLFTKGWAESLLKATSMGFAMVGPLSNAPGVTANGRQDITTYVSDYRTDDSQVYLDAVAKTVSSSFGQKFIASKVNGFFQFAAVRSWVAGSFSPGQPYRPENRRTSRGKLNPTPLMTLNEDELQARWEKKGMRSCVACGSFIFHYRAVSRGEKYKRGRWYRRNE